MDGNSIIKITFTKKTIILYQTVLNETNTLLLIYHNDHKYKCKMPAIYVRSDRY